MYDYKIYMSSPIAKYSRNLLVNNFIIQANVTSHKLYIIILQVILIVKEIFNNHGAWPSLPRSSACCNGIMWSWDRPPTLNKRCATSSCWPLFRSPPPKNPEPSMMVSRQGEASKNGHSLICGMHTDVHARSRFIRLYLRGTCAWILCFSIAWSPPVVSCPKAGIQPRVTDNTACIVGGFKTLAANHNSKPLLAHSLNWLGDEQ